MRIIASHATWIDNIDGEDLVKTMNYSIASLLLFGVIYSQSLWAVSGKYLSAGWGDFRMSGLKLSPAVEKSRESTGGRLAIGYKQCMTDILCTGPEFGIGYYGQSTWQLNGETFSLSSMGVDVQLVGNLTLYKSMYAVLKLGAIYHRLDNTFSNNNPAGFKKGARDAWKPIYTGGLGYSINDRWQLEFTYQGMMDGRVTLADLKSSRRKAPDINGYMLSIKYRFSQ